jgi:hypothetical protein
MRRPPSHRQAVEALAVLAGYPTAEDLAVMLVKADCRGEVSSQEACPLAVWLRRRLKVPDDDAWTINVDSEDLTLFHPTEGHLLEVLRLPGVAARFVVDYDAGKYAHLVLDRAGPDPG